MAIRSHRLIRPWRSLCVRDR
ncbi:UNVERIFIED_CONTAM: hypothetical protein GTU68_004352 [Idotea baltica]|nr:hypothetical protein [Idotea baltica]